MLDFENKSRLKIVFEILWNVMISLICLLVVWPIFQKVNGYPFLWTNIAFVLVFFTFTRYIFFLRYTYLSGSILLKLVLLVVSTFLFFILYYHFTNFRNFMDEQGLQSLFENLSAEDNFRLTRYIKGETIFFGVASILVSAILPVRLLISVWRQYNKKGTD